MLCEVDFGHRVVIPHSPLSILAPRMFFIHARNLQLRGMFLLLGLNQLGGEMGSNQLDKHSVRRNLIDISRGFFSFFAHPEYHWKGRHSLRDCVAQKGMLPFVGCVDVLEARIDLVQVSIALWLSSLAYQSAFLAPLQCDKPNFVGLAVFLLYPWLCVSLLVFPYSLGKIMPSLGMAMLLRD